MTYNRRVNTIPFAKVEAIGNNFVLVDGREMPETDWSRLAVEVCPRRFGVGADGLLVVLPSDAADFRMRMFNPDGSEDACGNGLRCVIAYVRGGESVLVEALDGLHRAEIIRASEDSANVRVNMGNPSVRASDIPAVVGAEEVLDYPLRVGGEVYNVTCVNIGTPHAVICAPIDAFWESIPTISAVIEEHPAFPQKISVTWCSRDAPDELRIRTWERAVGPTLGCGTGACSALVAANILGHAGDRARVTSPGGALHIEWPNRGEVYMSGPANIVFRGEWPLRRDKEAV